jgi:hypothetical protein
MEGTASLDIVAVGVQILRSRMRLLAGMLRAGVVTAEVRWVQLVTAGGVLSTCSGDAS